jgi:hypothetical protein
MAMLHYRNGLDGLKPLIFEIEWVGAPRGVAVRFQPKRPSERVLMAGVLWPVAFEQTVSDTRDSVKHRLKSVTFDVVVHVINPKMRESFDDDEQCYTTVSWPLLQQAGVYLKAKHVSFGSVKFEAPSDNAPSYNFWEVNGE